MISNSQANYKWRHWLPTWGPSVLMMMLIFIASAQPKHAPPVGTEPNVYLSGAMPVFRGEWDAIVKKSAHVIAYALLSSCLLYGLTRSGTAPRTAAYQAILLAMCYALTDEMHQMFVTGRNAAVLDLGFDYIGATSASLIGYRLVHRSATVHGNNTRPLPSTKQTSPKTAASNSEAFRRQSQ